MYLKTLCLALILSTALSAIDDQQTVVELSSLGDQFMQINGVRDVYLHEHFTGYNLSYDCQNCSANFSGNVKELGKYDYNDNWLAARVKRNDTASEMIMITETAGYTDFYQAPLLADQQIPDKDNWKFLTVESDPMVKCSDLEYVGNMTVYITCINTTNTSVPAFLLYQVNLTTPLTVQCVENITESF